MTLATTAVTSGMQMMAATLPELLLRRQLP
jgi:hypothetical protein